MNEYYTRKQAIERLGLRSTNAFLRLERKYPEGFVNVNPNRDREKKPRYDKAALDSFYYKGQYLKQEKL
jgi:hypothetical protein